MGKMMVRPTVRHWMMLKWLRVALMGSKNSKFLTPFKHMPVGLHAFQNRKYELSLLEKLEKEFNLARFILSDSCSQELEKQ